MKIWIAVCLFLGFVNSSVSFRKTFDCITQYNNQCTQWSQTIETINYSENINFHCFPQSTYLLTKQGPKSMAHLSVGDQVLGLNPDTGQNGFSPVLSWLHRDTLASIRYDRIKTQQNLSFTASDLHNIAFVDHQGKVSYKFAQDIQKTDQLISYPHRGFTVISNQQGQNMRGLYAPFTQYGNYFVYNSDFDPQKNDTQGQTMILAHVLSQVFNPQNSFKTALMIINNTPDLFGYNIQPSDDKPFVHPLYTNLRFVFGRDWVQQPIQVSKKISLNHQLSSGSNLNIHDFGYGIQQLDRYTQRHSQKIKIAVCIISANTLQNLAIFL